MFLLKLLSTASLLFCPASTILVRFFLLCKLTSELERDGTAKKVNSKCMCLKMVQSTKVAIYKEMLCGETMQNLT